MNKDIECKRKELQNIIRIQEDQSKRNNNRINGMAESPKENWNDTDNKLHQMLYHYFIITKVAFEWLHRVEKRNKSEQGARAIVAKLLNYKDKVYILRNTHYANYTTFTLMKKGKMTIHKFLWNKVKKLRQQRKYDVAKYEEIY